MSALPSVMRWAAEVRAACEEWPPYAPAMQLAQVQFESGGDPEATSGVGARGLVQLMPATAAGLGVRNIDDPGENLRGGAHLMSDNYRELHDWPLALFAYNAGVGNVEQVTAKLGTRDWNEIAARCEDWGWEAGQAAGVVAYVNGILSMTPVYEAALKATPEVMPAHTIAPEAAPTKEPVKRYMRIRIINGETLWQLADRYHTSVKELATVNDIADPNIIEAGAYLKVPL